jgi:hypothetical protein
MATLTFLVALSFGRAGEADDRMGSVSGRIAVAGDVPRPAPLPVVKHRSVCGDSKPAEDFVVSPSRSLANVVVTIEGVPRPYPEPRGLGLLDNVECVFVPHVQVLRVGQALEIRSSDRIIHTAHAYDETLRTLFNVALPVYKRSVRRILAHTGTYRIACDVGHTWMSAHVVVVGHPYAAVTDGAGRFRFSGVPPGSYRLRFWHERLGVRDEPVVVRSGGETIVNLAWRSDGSRPGLTNSGERAP